MHSGDKWGPFPRRGRGLGRNRATLHRPTSLHIVAGPRLATDPSGRGSRRMGRLRHPHPRYLRTLPLRAAAQSCPGIAAVRPPLCGGATSMDRPQRSGRSSQVERSPSLRWLDDLPKQPVCTWERGPGPGSPSRELGRPDRHLHRSGRPASLARDGAGAQRPVATSHPGRAVPGPAQSGGGGAGDEECPALRHLRRHWARADPPAKLAGRRLAAPHSPTHRVDP